MFNPPGQIGETMVRNNSDQWNSRRFSVGALLLTTLLLMAVTLALSADQGKVETIDATATGTSTQLSFQVPGSEDVFMDYATAIAVPEPSSALLLLLALPLFLAGPRLRLVGNK